MQVCVFQSPRRNVDQGILCSDHMLVEAEIVYEATFDRGPGIWKNNVKYYKDQDFLGRFTHFWNRRLFFENFLKFLAHLTKNYKILSPSE